MRNVVVSACQWPTAPWAPCVGWGGEQGGGKKAAVAQGLMGPARLMAHTHPTPSTPAPPPQAALPPPHAAGPGTGPSPAVRRRLHHPPHHLSRCALLSAPMPRCTCHRVRALTKGTLRNRTVHLLLQAMFSLLLVATLPTHPPLPPYPEPCRGHPCRLPALLGPGPSPQWPAAQGGQRAQRGGHGCRGQEGGLRRARRVAPWERGCAGQPATCVIDAPGLTGLQLRRRGGGPHHAF